MANKFNMPVGCRFFLFFFYACDSLPTCVCVCVSECGGVSVCALEIQQLRYINQGHKWQQRQQQPNDWRQRHRHRCIVLSSGQKKSQGAGFICNNFGLSQAFSHTSFFCFFFANFSFFNPFFVCTSRTGGRTPHRQQTAMCVNQSLLSASQPAVRSCKGKTSLKCNFEASFCVALCRVVSAIVAHTPRVPSQLATGFRHRISYLAACRLSLSPLVWYRD